MMSSEAPRTVYQPLHPIIRPRLDPEYVVYHDSVLQYLPADDERPWTPSFRNRANIINTTPVAVGSIRDVTIPKLSAGDKSPLQARVFTPESALLPPQSGKGWPVLLWFHGGGFVLGGLESENDLCALFCQTAGCVVVSVAYRLAPEHPYPAAAQDAVRALDWVASEEASNKLGSDAQRIAVGGTSAGGSLCAVAALHAASTTPRIRLTYQLLLVPVLDHTARTTSPSWLQRPHAPWLTPARILWYRSLYFGQPSSAAPIAAANNWNASPALAPEELLRGLPPTWIAVAGEDLLRGEAEEFADRLKSLGVSVRVQCYEGVGHSLLALSQILTKGRQLMHDAAEELRRGLHGEPGPGLW